MARQAAARTLSMSCGVRASWPRMGCAGGRWIASILWFFLRGCRLRVCVWPGRLRMPSASDGLRACETPALRRSLFRSLGRQRLLVRRACLFIRVGGVCRNGFKLEPGRAVAFCACAVEIALWHICIRQCGFDATVRMKRLDVEHGFSFLVFGRVSCAELGLVAR